ncbi:MAG: hypothetical protein HYW91_02815, partial [Candidatus Sungbacteria bacterium]|nr:hypothetical protein [Candidatus Sungbacteria bacterium]
SSADSRHHCRSRCPHLPADPGSADPTVGECTGSGAGRSGRPTHRDGESAHLSGRRDRDLGNRIPDDLARNRRRRKEAEMNRPAAIIILLALLIASAGIVLVHSRTAKFVTDDGRPNHQAIQRHLGGAEP